MIENDGAPAPVETTPVAVEPELPLDTAPAPEPKGDEPYTDEAFTEDLSTIWDKHNPVRGPDGKFATTKPAEEAPVEPVSDQSPTDKPAEPEKAFGMPQSWSADRKATWDALPSDAKEFITRREQEAQKAFTEQGQKIKAYEPLRSVFDQYRDAFERAGTDEVTGVARLLEAERFLDRDPVAGIKWLAQAHGVDLRKVAGLQPSGNMPPDVAALLERNEQLERRIQNFERRFEDKEKAEAETQFKTAETQIADFAKDKADWSELEKDTMGQIYALKAEIASGDKDPMQPLDLLKTAYERAQRVNPDAWAKKQERERVADEKKKIEEARKRTADARRGAPLNVKSSVANVPTHKTMDEDLAEIARKHYG